MNYDSYGLWCIACDMWSDTVKILMNSWQARAGKKFGSVSNRVLTDQVFGQDLHTRNLSGSPIRTLWPDPDLAVWMSKFVIQLSDILIEIRCLISEPGCLKCSCKDYWRIWTKKTPKPYCPIGRTWIGPQNLDNLDSDAHPHTRSGF